MARFQAQTNAVLNDELKELRRRLGLRSNQKADLLRELTALASWVVRQAIEGRAVQARVRYSEFFHLGVVVTLRPPSQTLESRLEVKTTMARSDDSQKFYVFASPFPRFEGDSCPHFVECG